MTEEVLNKGEVTQNKPEESMTREDLPDKSTTIGDDLTEAERRYFESGGQDVSALLDDPVYKPDTDSLNAEREAIEEQRSRQQLDPNDPTYQEIQAKKPTQEGQPPAQKPEQKATDPTQKEQTVGDDEEFEFEELHLGQDGRLRDKAGRFVPLSALHKERERFKVQRDSNTELRKQNDELRERFTKLNERVSTLQDVWNKPPQAAPELKQEEKPKTISEGLKELLTAKDIPTPEEDIFAHANWQKGVIEKSLEAISALEEMVSNNRKEIVEKEIQPVRQHITENDVISYYRQDAQNFVSQKPEFSEAYRYLMNQRHATLTLAGFTDADQRQSQIRQEERDLVGMAIQQNKRPAEFIYNYAVAAGFRPTSADPNPTPNPQPVIEQQPPIAAQQPPITAQQPSVPQGNNAERLLNQLNAQNASGTLSGTGGSSAETLSAEAIANMSERDFVALSEKLGRHGMRQFLGGA